MKTFIISRPEGYKHLVLFTAVFFLSFLSSNWCDAKGGGRTIRDRVKDLKEDRVVPPENPRARKNEVRANTESAQPVNLARQAQDVDLLEVIQNMPLPEDKISVPAIPVPETCPKRSLSSHELNPEKKPCPMVAPNSAVVGRIEDAKQGAAAVADHYLAKEALEEGASNLASRVLSGLMSEEMEQYLSVCKQFSPGTCRPDFDTVASFEQVYVMNNKWASQSAIATAIEEARKKPENKILLDQITKSFEKLKANGDLENQSPKNTHEMAELKKNLLTKAAGLHSLYKTMNEAKEKFELEKYRLALHDKPIQLNNSQLYLDYLKTVNDFEGKYANYLKSAHPRERDFLSSKRFRDRIQGESPFHIHEFNGTDWSKMAESVMKEQRKKLSDLIGLQKQIQEASSDAQKSEVYRKILNYDPLSTHEQICKTVADPNLASKLRDLVRFDYKGSGRNVSLSPNSLSSAEEFRKDILAKLDLPNDHELTRLVASNQLQRAYWHLMRNGKKSQAESLERIMREYVDKNMNHPETQVVNLSTGANASRIVTFPNGMRGIFKPFDGIDRSSPVDADSERGEALTYQLDRMGRFNLVPLSMNVSLDEVGKGEKKGSFQLWVDHATIVVDANSDREFTRPRSPAVRALYLLSGNFDDHDGNLMKFYNEWEDPKKFVSIDNAKAFSLGSLTQVKPLAVKFHESLTEQFGNLAQMKPEKEKEFQELKKEILAKLKKIRKELPKMTKDNAFHDVPEYSQCHSRLLAARMDCVEHLLNNLNEKTCPNYRNVLDQSPECKETYPKMVQEAEAGAK